MGPVKFVLLLIALAGPTADLHAQVPAAQSDTSFLDTSPASLDSLVASDDSVALIPPSTDGASRQPNITDQTSAASDSAVAGKVRAGNSITIEKDGKVELAGFPDWAWYPLMSLLVISIGALLYRFFFTRSKTKTARPNTWLPVLVALLAGLAVGSWAAWQIAELAVRRSVEPVETTSSPQVRKQELATSSAAVDDSDSLSPSYRWDDGEGSVRAQQGPAQRATDVPDAASAASVGASSTLFGVAIAGLLVLLMGAELIWLYGIHSRRLESAQLRDLGSGPYTAALTEKALELATSTKEPRIRDLARYVTTAAQAGKLDAGRAHVVGEDLQSWVDQPGRAPLPEELALLDLLHLHSRFVRQLG
ncbi:MAG TPA: hypothetical protein VFT45_00445 [Longimicrobium sp.]|nr:hypothetical protein [Longimicrobium sp.]